MKNIVICFLLLLSIKLKAQQFGGNPASIKWKQINTTQSKIIFPAGKEADANQVAAITSLLSADSIASIGAKLKKISIILQPQTIISNGYVQLAPWRSEFYLMPPQNTFQLGAFNWRNNLAIHEWRHVQQYSNFNKGLSAIGKVLLGEQGQALLNAAAVPDWFFEGDAVYAETKYSPQGRGRLPLFINNYNTLFQSGYTYSYQKMRNGSLRDFVPNHYDLGYLLVAYGYEKYGNDFWKKVSEDAAAFKPLVYPLQGAVKKHSGIAFKDFVRTAMGFYQQQWDKQPNQNIEWLTQTEKNNVIDYKYPYLTKDGVMIVLKRSNKKIPAFVSIDANGVEARLATRDIAVDDYFSYKNDKIVYTAYQPDARWGYRDYNNIKILDINTKEEKTVLAKTKLFSPDINEEGNLITAVEVIATDTSSLKVFTNTGEEKNKIAVPGYILSYPKFYNNQTIVAAARKTNGEMGIIKFNLINQSQEIILPFKNAIIGFLNVQGDTLLFSATANKTDAIWALQLNTNKLFKLADYATGLYQAAMRKDGKLVSSAFTANGYRLLLQEPKWQQVQSANQLAALYINAEKFAAKPIPILNNQYDVTRYKKAFHLFNFHSWQPEYVQPEFNFYLMGENILQTLQSNLTYTFNENEASHKLAYTAVYGGSFVQPFGGFSKTWNRNIFYNKDTSFFWNETGANIGLQLPLNFTGGKQFKNLFLAGSFHTDNVNFAGSASKLFRNQHVNYMQVMFNYTSRIQKAVQQIFPHFSQSFFMRYRTAVNDITANQFLANASISLPGFTNNHSIVLQASYQSRDTMNRYAFNNSFPFSRGYTAVNFPRMVRVGANYHFPLFYPEWGLGNIVYFLRIRANCFYDYTQAKSLRTGRTFDFATAGSEIFFDTRWWNQQPVTFGIRYSRLLNNEFAGITQPNQWEFIMPIGLF